MSRKHENKKRICSISFHFLWKKGRNDGDGDDARVVLGCWFGRDVSPLPPSRSPLPKSRTSIKSRAEAVICILLVLVFCFHFPV